MTEEQRCKLTALERLEDAFVLYEEERYEATLYMCGYVIELGIKYEFHKLANTQLNDVEHKAGFIRYLFDSDYFKDTKDEKYADWLNGFHFPETILELVHFINNIALLSKQSDKKLLYNRIAEESEEFYVILNNRQKPLSSSKAKLRQNKDNEEEKYLPDKFHNITGFLKSLNNFRNKIKGNSFNPDEYDIVKKLGWTTKMRYAENISNQINTNDDEIPEMDITMTPQEKAENGLDMAIDFLQDVAQINVSNYKARLHPTSESDYSNTTQTEYLYD